MDHEIDFVVQDFERDGVKKRDCKGMLGEMGLEHWALRTNFLGPRMPQVVLMDVATSSFRQMSLHQLDTRLTSLQSENEKTD